jgi:hypothetical protein
MSGFVTMGCKFTKNQIEMLLNLKKLQGVKKILLQEFIQICIYYKPASIPFGL